MDFPTLIDGTETTDALAARMESRLDTRSEDQVGTAGGALGVVARWRGGSHLAGQMSMYDIGLVPCHDGPNGGKPWQLV